MAGRNPTITINSGDVYGRLTVRSETRNNGRRAADCICVCKNTKVINIAALVSGSVTSCGCLRKELAATRASDRSRTTQPVKYRIDDKGRECAGNYCGNVYKEWADYNKGNAANGHNSWCRECTRAHYLSRANSTN